MVNAFSDYSSANSTIGGSSPGTEGDDNGYWALSKCKRAYTDYLNTKTDEIEEQKNARRYDNGSQWTDTQIKELNKRRQPVVTYNRIAPKINGVIGLLEKLKQAPKAYPRTPKEQEGADLATAVVRYVLDAAEWKDKSWISGRKAAVEGYGGVELLLEQGDQGDPDVTFEYVEPDSFFYDPRSYKLDFSDARFMGMGKWIDAEQAKEMFPDKADMLDDTLGSDLTTNADRENKWFMADGDQKRVRLVDIWYKMKGEWYWTIFTGAGKLAEGKSYLHDEKGKSFCKYIMFSSSIDQDGDRYGFIRNYKSIQDEINQRRSKALHQLNSRRILAQRGAVQDIEKTRLEAVRPDGVVIFNDGDFKFEFDDMARQAEIEGQLKFLQESKEELDSYGPTLSLIGETGVQLSGRAISLQQQAGVAQLGPFILAYRGWKIRVYRAIWNAVREHWKAERWVRVTDHDDAVQFVGINQLGVNPMTGMPTMVNSLGALDVDIIMDEGPDSVNMAADTFDALQALAQSGAQIPPDILLELAPGLDIDTKRRMIQKINSPNPMQQQAQMLELQQAQADVEDKQAAAGLKKAQTIDTMKGDQGGAPVNPAREAAEIEGIHAKTDLTRAQAMTTVMQPTQEERKLQAEQEKQQTDLAMQAHMAEREREMKFHEQDMKRRAEEDKLRREEELHQATLAEKQMRLRMDLDQHEHQKRMDQSDVGQAVTTRKDAAASKQKMESGLAEAIKALAQNSKESTNAIVKAMSSLSESANVMGQSAAMMAKASTATKKAIRDKNGRIIGVETVNGG